MKKQKTKKGSTIDFNDLNVKLLIDKVIIVPFILNSNYIPPLQPTAVKI